MATANRFHNAIDRMGVHDEEHPVWAASFDDEVRLRQLQDDLRAGKSVSGVLVTIVSVGLVLAIVSVLIVM